MAIVLYRLFKPTTQAQRHDRRTFQTNFGSLQFKPTHSFSLESVDDVVGAVDRSVVEGQVDQAGVVDLGSVSQIRFGVVRTSRLC